MKGVTQLAQQDGADHGVVAEEGLLAKSCGYAQRVHEEAGEGQTDGGRDQGGQSRGGDCVGEDARAALRVVAGMGVLARGRGVKGSSRQVQVRGQGEHHSERPVAGIAELLEEERREEEGDRQADPHRREGPGEIGEDPAGERGRTRAAGVRCRGQHRLHRRRRPAL